MALQFNAPKAGLIYGPSDTGKTSQFGFMAEWIYRKYGKTTRLISADGGGWAPLAAHIELGIIEPYSVLDSPAPLETLSFLLQGHWPYKDGKPVKLGTRDSEPTSTTWDKVGAYGIEGLYSISTLLMQFLSNNGQLASMAGGAQAKGQGVLSQIKDGSDTWTQAGVGFYNFILQKMGKYVIQSSALPVHKVLWTSLIGVYERRKGEEVIEHGPWGPLMVGQQGIRVVPQWFGDLIHFDIVHEAVIAEDRPDRNKSVPAAKVGTVQKKVRAYLKSHTHHKDGELVPAKPRVPPDQYHKLPAYKDFAAEEGFIGWLYDQEDTLENCAVDALRERLRAPVEAASPASK